MDIENALTYLGFNEIPYNTVYFRTYQKETHTLFVYNSSSYQEKRFSSSSGEFTGGVNELVLFFYLTQSSSELTERDRLELFYKKHPDSPIDYEPLKAIPSFSLYTILLENGTPYKNNTFNNIIQIGDVLHLMFLDEEKTTAKGLNILGVISYNLINHESEVFNFSDISRSIYFSNPSIPSDTAIVFNDIKEMLSFEKMFDKDYFFVLVQDFNENIAKTLKFLLKGKSIDKTILAFPDTTQGYFYDLKYISVFSKMLIKEKEGYIKLTLQQTENTEKFISRLKDFKSSILKTNKGIDTEFIIIKNAIGIQEEVMFSIEVALISNILKGFLVLASKYLLKDKEFKIIKPEKVYWQSSKDENLVEKDFNLKLATLRENYSFI